MVCCMHLRVRAQQQQSNLPFFSPTLYVISTAQFVFNMEISPRLQMQLQHIFTVLTHILSYLFQEYIYFQKISRGKFVSCLYLVPVPIFWKSWMETLVSEGHLSFSHSIILFCLSNLGLRCASQSCHRVRHTGQTTIYNHNHQLTTSSDCGRRHVGEHANFTQKDPG